MKEQLKKAKAIIEGYDGPAVRVMDFAAAGGTDFWSGLSGLCDTGRFY